MIIHPNHQQVVKLYSLFPVYQEVRMLQSLFEWLEMFKNWRASECGKLMWIIPPKMKLFRISRGLGEDANQESNNLGSRFCHLLWADLVTSQSPLLVICKSIRAPVLSAKQDICED